MPITEFAILRLKGDLTPKDPTLRANLLRAKHTMESFTENTFHYYTQLEDPTLIYIIGQWSSLSQHMDEFIPSAANQDLLRLLGPYVEIDTFFHIDVSNQELPLAAPCVSVERLVVKCGTKEHFITRFEEKRSFIQASVSHGPLGGGWRLEREQWDADTDAIADQKKDEFVLFSGWESQEEHLAVEEKEASNELRAITEFAASTDIKHLVRLDVEDV